MKKYFIHNKWLTTIISIPIVLLVIFVAPKLWVADTPTITWEKYLSVIVAWLSSKSDIRSKKEALALYCETMTDSVVVWWYLDENNIYYSPKNSLFVQALCKWVSSEDIFYNKNLIKWTSRNQILWNNIQWCEWSTFSECKLDELLPALFNATMNDHSTLSIAWWTMKEGEDWLHTAVQEFSQKYFTSLSPICGDKNSEYIGTNSSTSPKNGLCSHPSTYQSLKNTIQWLQKQINNLRIINFAWNVQCDTTDIYKSYFECAYTNQTSQEAWWYQHNLWYNELLYYKLLISRLTENKLKDSKIKPLNLTKDITIDLSDERQNLKREAILSENAVQIMQKTINNIRATFPLHIWLQVYYEDVVAFRKSLVKIYTPIHQLYYKLRNIQEKK